MAKTASLSSPATMAFLGGFGGAVSDSFRRRLRCRHERETPPIDLADIPQPTVEATLDAPEEQPTPPPEDIPIAAAAAASRNISRSSSKKERRRRGRRNAQVALRSSPSRSEPSGPMSISRAKAVAI